MSRSDEFCTERTPRRSCSVRLFVMAGMMEMVERQDLDMVILFYNPVMIDPKEPDITSIVRRCDQYNIPVATNIATAELLILGLARGDLDWRLNLK